MANLALPMDVKVVGGHFEGKTGVANGLITFQNMTPNGETQNMVLLLVVLDGEEGVIAPIGFDELRCEGIHGIDDDGDDDEGEADESGETA